MMLRLTPEATMAEREAVVAEIELRGVRATARDGALLLDRALADDDAVAIAAMPGVAEISRTVPGQSNLREAALLWVAGAAAVLGVLALFAANLSATLGTRADPLRTPGRLRPSWPLLPWYSAVDKAPAWVPFPLLLVAAAILLFVWPSLGRRLAERSPALHTALGVVVILAVAGLAFLEATR